MNTPQPLVSIVTPVYNEAAYIAECIESVLAQTYQNWDYTIVDNCSADSTLEIARRYAARDSRIRIHRNEKLLAPIANHNLGLRQISPQSKYCKIVFGDDWIFSNCLEEMVGVAEEHPSVAIVGAYALEGRKVAWTGLPYPSRVVNGRTICRHHLLDRLYVFGSANAVLYRADLVRSRNPFYNESNIHADTEVCFALLNTWDFGFVHQVLTFTRVREGSLAAGSGALATHFPFWLQLLKRYGPDYLSSEESESLLKRHWLEYYRYLGKNLVLGRDKRLWEYHRQELGKAGIKLSRSRVLRGAFETLLEAALNPKLTSTKLKVVRRNSRLSPKEELVSSKTPVSRTIRA